MGQTGLFNFGIATNLRERKLWIIFLLLVLNNNTRNHLSVCKQMIDTK